jgi:elongator complex protein 5
MESRGEGGVVDFGTTFNLGVTERQMKSKEEVVLPHFGARGGSSGDIEYTLGVEDDFDDEEDVDEDLLI